LAFLVLRLEFVPFRRIQNRPAFNAALTASILWELAKQGFRLYLLNVADWNLE
jgi:uncharacterized BrkB/YihY/UPF0761 family membrane protein